MWKFGSDGNHGRYFSCLADCLERALATMQPSLVVMEAPLPHTAPKTLRSSRHAVRVLLGLAAVTEMVCHEQGVRCEEADVRDARQMVLGHQPRDGKLGVMAWCRLNGWKPSDDNAGDALLLLAYRQALASQEFRNHQR